MDVLRFLDASSHLCKRLCPSVGRVVTSYFGIHVCHQGGPGTSQKCRILFFICKSGLVHRSVHINWTNLFYPILCRSAIRRYINQFKYMYAYICIYIYNEFFNNLLTSDRRQKPRFPWPGAHHEIVTSPPSQFLSLQTRVPPSLRQETQVPLPQELKQNGIILTSEILIKLN